MNLTAALLIILKYGKRIKGASACRLMAIAVLMLMISGMIFSENIASFVEGGLYRDTVILSEQTKYQKIVMTKHRDDLRLYIDGNVQFSSKDEYRYHEALVHIPMSKAAERDRVLVLGGGDGLAARELLKYENTQVVLVDLDEGMTGLCSEHPGIVELNQGSLTSERVKIINQDAYRFLETNKELFDVILVDLPDPNNESLNKLYSNIFYRLCKNSLKEDGVMVVQSTSPYYAAKAFWCIHDTLESEGFYVKPYHLQVPAFGDWGFNLASRRELDDSFHLQVETRYLTEENISAMFAFGKDEVAENVEINRLSKPKLMQYYNEAVRNWE